MRAAYAQLNLGQNNVIVRAVAVTVEIADRQVRKPRRVGLARGRREVTLARVGAKLERPRFIVARDDEQVEPAMARRSRGNEGAWRR